jgi:hypothetical protein
MSPVDVWALAVPVADPGVPVESTAPCDAAPLLGAVEEVAVAHPTTRAATTPIVAKAWLLIVPSSPLIACPNANHTRS